MVQALMLWPLYPCHPLVVLPSNSSSHAEAFSASLRTLTFAQGEAGACCACCPACPHASIPDTTPNRTRKNNPFLIEIPPSRSGFNLTLWDRSFNQEAVVGRVSDPALVTGHFGRRRL